jgi:hypothetical protein
MDFILFCTLTALMMILPKNVCKHGDLMKQTSIHVGCVYFNNMLISYVHVL